MVRVKEGERGDGYRRLTDIKNKLEADRKARLAAAGQLEDAEKTVSFGAVKFEFGSEEKKRRFTVGHGIAIAAIVSAMVAAAVVIAVTHAHKAAPLTPLQPAPTPLTPLQPAPTPLIPLQPPPHVNFPGQMQTPEGNRVKDFLSQLYNDPTSAYYHNSSIHQILSDPNVRDLRFWGVTPTNLNYYSSNANMSTFYLRFKTVDGSFHFTSLQAYAPLTPSDLGRISHLHPLGLADPTWVF